MTGEGELPRVRFWAQKLSLCVMRNISLSYQNSLPELEINLVPVYKKPNQHFVHKNPKSYSEILAPVDKNRNQAVRFRSSNWSSTTNHGFGFSIKSLIKVCSHPPFPLSVNVKLSIVYKE